MLAALLYHHCRPAFMAYCFSLWSTGIVSAILSRILRGVKEIQVCLVRVAFWNSLLVTYISDCATCWLITGLEDIWVQPCILLQNHEVFRIFQFIGSLIFFISPPPSHPSYRTVGTIIALIRQNNPLNKCSLRSSQSRIVRIRKGFLESIVKAQDLSTFMLRLCSFDLRMTATMTYILSPVFWFFAVVLRMHSTTCFLYSSDDYGVVVVVSFAVYQFLKHSSIYSIEQRKNNENLAHLCSIA